MTPEQRKRLNELCRKVQQETDPKRFDESVHELNELLEEKHEPIHTQERVKKSA